FKNNLIMRIVFALLFVAMGTLFVGCSKKSVATHYTYKTECMGVELDGSQTLKAWGNGRKRMDAVEQAKKNAVRDVIFIRVTDGKAECNMKPIVFEVNAQQKYENAFNASFAGGGEYKACISLRGEIIFVTSSRDGKRASDSVTRGLIVRVLRAEV